MEAKELRISNLVHLIADGHENEPDLLIWELEDYDFYENKMEYIKPIPLTEEWLLKFGFRHIMNNWYNIHASNNTFNVYLFDEIGYRVEIVSQSIAVLKYTHQLQNLYFALTGTELTIK